MHVLCALCRIVDTILNNAEVYNKALGGDSGDSDVTLATTVQGLPGALVIPCGSEAVAISVCNCHGCRGRLSAVNTPTSGDPFAGLSPPFPGMSANGPMLKTWIDCWCTGGDPVPTDAEPASCLSPDACMNGGFCR